MMKTGQAPVPADKKRRSASRDAVLRAAAAAWFLGTLATSLNAAIDPEARLAARPVSSQYFAQAGEGTPPVPPVRRERPQTPEAAQSEPQSPSSDTGWSFPEMPGVGGLWGSIQDWLARANRDYQGVVIKELSLPPSGPGDDAIARKLDDTKREDARAAAAARQAEEGRKAAAKQKEAKQKQDAARKAAETKAAADKASADAANRAKAESERAKAAAKAEAERAKAAAKSPPPDTAAKEAERAAADAEAQRLINEREEKAQREAEERRKTAERQRRDAEAQELRRAEAEDRRRADAEKRKTESEQRETEKRIADSRRQERDEGATTRSRRVTLTAEPIPRPSPVASVYRPELAGRGARRFDGDDDDEFEAAPSRRGSSVRRWFRRHHSGSCRAAGRRIRPPGRYVVARGDTLWQIAGRHYRKGRLYRKIYRANRHKIRRPGLIYPCQRLYLPRRRG